MPPENEQSEPLEGAALHAHVTNLLADHMQDVDKRFNDTMEHLEGLEAKLSTTFTTKLDAKFQEVLARLPPTRAPPPAFVGRAQRVPKPPAQTSAAGAAAGAAGAKGATNAAMARDAQFDDYYGENEFEGEYADEFEVD